MSKKEKKPLEPYQTLDSLVQFTLKVCYIVVGDYLNPSWSWKSSLAIWHIILLEATSLIFYVFYGYQHRHEMDTIIFIGCLILVNLLEFQRMLTWSSNQSMILEINNFLLEYTKKWEQVEEAFPVLLWYYRLLKPLISLVAVMSIVMLSFQAVLPILYYLLTGKMLIFVECYIPYVDYHTHPGWEYHVMYHAYLIALLGAGLISVTNYLLIMFFQICAQTDVLRARLQVLTNKIHCSKPKKDEVTKFLKDILEEHQSLIEYIDIVEQSLTLQNFSDHFLGGVTTCLSLFVCLQRFWAFGYVILGAGVIIIFPIDLLGTITEIKLEKLLMDIYDVPWYLLSINNQRMFCYFLKGAQNTARLTLMGRYPLSLETLARLYKGIYSYLMIMRETLA